MMMLPAPSISESAPQGRARRPSRPAPRRLPVAEELEPAQGWSYRVYERRKSKIVIVILFDGDKGIRRSEWPRLNMLQRGKSMSEARFRPRGLWFVGGASQ
jgi:hypothetical protein